MFKHCVQYIVCGILHIPSGVYSQKHEPYHYYKYPYGNYLYCRPVLYNVYVLYNAGLAV